VARSGGSGAYDRFRDRLMFPIRDVQGRTIAFGGRCLDGSEPKYINSPETATYVKGSHLYGLDRARDAIRAEQRAVVVEGYLDLAAAVQAGVGNVVATLGTAFTPEQARLLKRYTDRVVVSYDGDTAGQNATARSLDLLLESGFDVRVAELPPGSDPDDCIRDEGDAAYRRRLDEAPVYFEFLVRREARSRDLSQVGEKVAAVNALLPRLARMPSAVERASWAGRIADELRIDDELVLQELRAALRGRHERIRQRAATDGPLRPAEALLVTRLLQDEAGEAPAVVEPGDVAGTRIAAIVGAILDLRRATGAADFPRVFAALDSEEDRRLLARIAVTDPGNLETEGLGECVRVLRLDRLVRERGELQRQIERAADPSALDALLVKKQEIGRLIDGL
jgi:DNA primase